MARSSQSSLDHSGSGAPMVTEWRSIYFVCAIVIMDALSVAMVQVNSFPYLNSMDPNVSEEFFGLTKSMFTLGSILAALVAGWLSNHISHTKPPILAGTLCSLLTCLLYANLEVLPVQWRKMAFLLTQLTFGLGAGAITTWRVLIAMESTECDRQKATALIGLSINGAFIAGPLVVLPLGYLLSGSISLPWGTHLSIFTAPTYVQGSVCLFCLSLLAACYDGRIRKRTMAAGKEDRWATRGRGADTEKAPLGRLAVPGGNNNEDDSSRSASPVPPASPSKSPAASKGGAAASNSGSKLDVLAVCVCIMAKINLCLFILYLMALSNAYAMTVFGWSGEQMVVFQMCVQGLMGLMGVLISLGYTFRLLSHFEERFCVLGSLSLMLLFFLVSFPWPFLSAKLPEPRFTNVTGTNGTVTKQLVSNGCNRSEYTWCDSTPAINVYIYHATLVFCLGLAMPIGQLNLDVLYSRILGPIKQGTMQGFFVATGDVAIPRFSHFYQAYGPRPIWLCLITLFSIGIAMWALCYRRLLSVRTVGVKCRLESPSQGSQSSGSKKNSVGSMRGMIPVEVNNILHSTKHKREMLHSD